MSQAFQQPRDEDGRFLSYDDAIGEAEEIVSEADVELILSEFEARMIGHRLFEASERYDGLDNCRMDQESLEWAKKFHEKCKGRECDEEYYDKGEKRHVDAVYPVRLELTSFEVWMIGNRLWEVGEAYGIEGYDHIEAECKWWARRFHASRSE